MPQNDRYRVLLAFALLYVFWGSTYLGIRLAIDYLPPLLMAGTRFLIAGLVMLAYCAWSGRRVRLSWAELWRIGIVGILLLGIANVVLAWSEKVVPTGLAALIVAIVPLWLLLVNRMFFPEQRISRTGLLGLALGMVGIVVLLWPKLTISTTLGRRELLSSLALIGSSFIWAFGSVLSKKWQTQVDPFSASAWQMTVAGVLDTTLALLIGEHHSAVWDPRGIAAVLYLVVCGSWIGFSAYIWLLQHVPTAKLATYAYVNPVVAVFLGWLILHERVDGFILAGSAVIIISVAMVTRAKTHTRTREAQPEFPAVESSAD